MPELPEVQMVVTTLRPKLIGSPIRRVRVLRSDVIRPKDVDLAGLMEGRHVTDISRRGKKINITLSGGDRLYIHLGMSGRLALESSNAPLQPHTHLILELEDGIQVRFRDPRRFGGVWWLGMEAADEHLGPEPLDVAAKELFGRLHRTRRAVKTALLDQRLIAGIGNIYADEALFAAHIHPQTPASSLTRDQAAELCRAIKRTLKRAIRYKGSTLRDYRDADGNSGDFQKLHRVYGRTGQRCSDCGRPVERIVLGGRSTHLCPSCQPL